MVLPLATGFYFDPGLFSLGLKSSQIVGARRGKKKNAQRKQVSPGKKGSKLFRVGQPAQPVQQPAYFVLRLGSVSVPR